MKTKLSLFLLVFFLGMHMPSDGWTCTTFVLKNGGNQVLYRNYDWGFDDALIVISNRGCRTRQGDSHVA